MGVRSEAEPPWVVLPLSPSPDLPKETSSLSRWFASGRLIPVNDIAVDLGTANTLVYVKGEGIVLNEPSVVAVEKGSRRILGVGLQAKRMLGRTPEGIEAVRPLKDGVIADVDVTEMMLRHFLKQVTAKRIFRIKPRVVVGVPSGITELERRAVRSSAMAAGAKVVYMVAEPMAAAIGVGLPVETPTGNMVIDIGGEPRRSRSSPSPASSPIPRSGLEGTSWIPPS